MKQRFNIHQFLYKFFTGYGYAATFIFLILGASLYYSYNQTHIYGVTVSDDRKIMICDSNIKVYSAENASDFLYHRLQKNHDASFSSIICTIDILYDYSEKDKKAIAQFVDRKMSLWFFRRKDIEEYFYFVINEK